MKFKLKPLTNPKPKPKYADCYVLRASGYYGDMDMDFNLSEKFKDDQLEELDGKLGEFIAYASMPGTSGTDMTHLEKAEGYLAHKWGLTNSLPSSHPYKNSPPTT